MLMLQDLDSKSSCDREVLGYASMFQFYLDFFALAVTSTGLEGSQAFPVKPQDGRSYDPNHVWNRKDINSPGWKPLKEVQSTLNLQYWRSHPLQHSWRCLEVDDHDDNKTWRGASDALKAESFGENDLLALARTMSMFISRLDPFHKEFQKSLRAKAIQRRRCHIL